MPTDDVQIAMVRSGGSGNGSGGSSISSSGITRNDSIGNDCNSLASSGAAGGAGSTTTTNNHNSRPSSSKLSKQGSCREFISKASKARIGGGKGGSLIPVALYRATNARYTLVYSHGNATDIGAMHDRCAGIAKAVGVNVLAYDYTGYGLARCVENRSLFWLICVGQKQKVGQKNVL